MNVPSRDLQTLFEVGSLGGLSDGQLLNRFVARREEAAFEAIVRRHGPMVWGVCHRVLRDRHDAEDSFQATFLVLARKAPGIAHGEKVGNWLYGVAYKTATKARATRARRKGREAEMSGLPEPEASSDGRRDDRVELLDREIGRLPDRYRIPIVLCELEGRTHREAAEQLGWPIGTVSGRLSRARSMLEERLSRRGFTHSVGSLALLSQSLASASVPLPLIALTTRAATVVAARRGAAGVVSLKVAALMEGVLKEMLMTKLKIVMAVLTIVALGAAGTRSFGPGQRAEAGQEVAVATRPIAGENARPKWVIAAAPLPGPDQPSAPLPVTYKVQWRVSGVGQEDSLGPSVTTLGGHPARIHLGTNTNAPNGEVLPLGLVFTATTTPMQDGQVCVSVRADRFEREHAEGEGLRVQGESLQIIRVVKLGEAIDLEFKSSKGDPLAKPTRLSLNVVGQSK